MVLSYAGALDSCKGRLVNVDEKERWVYFTSNKHALKERHLYRVRIDGKGLERLTQEDGVHVVTLSPSLKYFLDTHSNSSTPPSLSLYNAEGTKILTVGPSAKNILENFRLAFPEFCTFQTEDRLDLPAMMTQPGHFSPEKKYPAIVYVYGGPGAQQVLDRWGSRLLWNSLLAQEGFFVFVFEVRAGMGKNKALETSVYRKAYGMQNVKDILAGIRWLKSMPYIDPERIGIWGRSGGGCTTLYTMTHSDAFKAGIAVAPVSDWHFYDTIYTERYQSTPQDNPDGYKETSSVLSASNLKGKLFIVHGTYDDNVHPQNTFAFTNNLIKHNIPFELMIYPWRKHGISDTPARVHLYHLMLDFWKRNLRQ
ncbi:Dipeptidyl aminopeptidase 4 [subsurface metagenome]